MKPGATARVLKKVEIVAEITGFHLEKTAPYFVFRISYYFSVRVWHGKQITIPDALRSRSSGAGTAAGLGFKAPRIRYGQRLSLGELPSVGVRQPGPRPITYSRSAPLCCGRLALSLSLFLFSPL